MGRACTLAAGFAQSTGSGASARDILAGAETKLMDLARSAALIAPPDFDEAAYLELYPDVADSVSRGEFSCAFAHFILHGKREGRRRPAA